MPNKKEAPTLTEQLRAAIQQSGQSLAQLGKACGVDAPRLSRFVRGERGLSLEAVDRIASVLRLHLAKADEPPDKMR
jgi:transcriptional regulator with XRE-family HTH domain